MKTSFVTAFFLLCLSVASALHHRAAVPSPTTSTAIRSLRGGDHVSKVISKDGLTKFAAAYFLAQGAPRAADPITYWDHYGLEIESGSLAAASAESNGFSALGIAIMSYLALFTDLSPSKIIAYASIPCLFFFFKTCYSGSFTRLGFWKGFGSVTTSLILFPICLLLAGKGDPDIVAAVLYGPCLAFGVLGYVLPGVSLKLCGLESFETPMDEVYWKLQCFPFIFWGTHAYMTMKGKSAFEAMKIVFAVAAPGLLDLRFVRPITKEISFPKAAMNFYVIFVLLMTTLFYALDFESASAAPPGPAA